MADVTVHLLWRTTDAITIRGRLENEVFELDTLSLPGGEVYPLDESLLIPEASQFLRSVGVNEYVFQQIADLNLTLEAGFLITLAAQATLFNVKVNLDADLQARFVIRIPPAGQATSDTNPFLSVEICAHLEVGGGAYSSDEVCFQVVVNQLPAAIDTQPLPALSFDLPDLGLRLPRMRLPWSYPKIALPVLWSARSVNLPGIDIRISWEGVKLVVKQDQLEIVFEGLQIKGLAGGVEADVTIVLKNGVVQTGLSRIELKRIGVLAIDGWHIDDDCLLVKWKGADLNALVRVIAPGVSVPRFDPDTRVVLRVMFTPEQVQEIRFDVKPSASSQLNLPGFALDLPKDELWSLIYRSAALDGVSEPDRNTVYAVMTVPKDAGIALKSTFTWTRDAERELHHDAGANNNGTPLVQLVATPTEAVSLCALKFPLGSSPQLLRQLEAPLTQIWPVEGPVCGLTGLRTQRLMRDKWKIDFSFNTDKFQLPLLNSRNDSVAQFINIRNVTPRLPPDFEHTSLSCGVEVVVTIGPISLQSTLDLEFNWESFGFQVDHDAGIDFILPGPQRFGFLGLDWVFKPPQGNRPSFKLITKNSNYKLIQLEGTRIELHFTRATSADQPIIFEVENFELSPAGISLDARVTDRPAKLNGLETEFKFTDGMFRIRGNRIQGFSIHGSGPLPPALVGEATAEIGIQFEMRGNSLELKSGMAQLKGTKFMRGSKSRFEYEVYGLSLRFVNDNGYHLYFTVTGVARYNAGGSRSGPLGWLPGIEIKLLDCPLTGNGRVIAKHIQFLVYLAKPVSFDVFGCFTMELKGIGFIPQFDRFDDAPALQLAGQVKFSDSGADKPKSDSNLDKLHHLFVGLPKKGSVVPRVLMEGLDVNLSLGDAFSLGCSVDMINNEFVAPGVRGNGFKGSGWLKIGELNFAASFGYLTINREGESKPVKAWFIYVEARQVSFKIPVIEVFLREVGLGFGYRFTLLGLKVADETNDPKKLIRELKRLSRTQGNLADAKNWAVDPGQPGRQPPFTIAMRAIVSQTSAGKSIFDWRPDDEKKLANLFLLEAVVAIRSDLTFLMVARGWINTNYYKFHQSVQGNGTLHERPLVSGFVLLSPKQKRLLAHVASNPEGEFGDDPPVADYLKRAVRNSQFSATLLIEPSLVHFELGWPNMLRWSDSYGPLQIELRGGAIIRTSRTELVFGLSFEAVGKLKFHASTPDGWVGARVDATAEVTYSTRYIGVADYRDPQRSALFYATNVSIEVDVTISAWIEIDKWWGSYTRHFNLGGIHIGFSASLEIGVLGSGAFGLRGTGTFSHSVCGHDVDLNVRLGLNEGAVETARSITDRFLSIGLEATEVEPIPGTENESLSLSAPAGGGQGFVNAAHAAGIGHAPEAANEVAANEVAAENDSDDVAPAGPPADATAGPTVPFLTPPYSVLQKQSREFVYFMLMPSGKEESAGTIPGLVRKGFYPVPPRKDVAVTSDFLWKLPSLRPGAYLQQYDPVQKNWHTIDTTATERAWKAKWDWEFPDGLQLYPRDGSQIPAQKTTLAHMMRFAYVLKKVDTSGADPKLDDIEPLRDPEKLPESETVVDERTRNPSDAAFEAAVRGANEQFEGAPYFKRDIRNSRYQYLLDLAFKSDKPSIYQHSTSNPLVANETIEHVKDEQSVQMRGMIIMRMIADFQTIVDASVASDLPAEIGNAIGFQMGCGFRALLRSPKPVKKGGQNIEIIELSPGQLDMTTVLPAGTLTMLSNASRKVTDHRVQTLRAGGAWLVVDVDRMLIIEKNPSDGKLFVFDVQAPDSVEDLVSDPTQSFGQIQQRTKPDDVTAAEPTTDVILFNKKRYSFRLASPKPRSILQFEHSSSIVFDWQLAWPDADDGQERDDDPEQHLMYYLVQRRALGDLNEGEKQFRLKRVHPLCREVDEKTQEAKLYRLQSQFALADHFADDSPEDIAAIPAGGKSYIYTITPVGYDNELGESFTLVATRRPTEPPRVPADAKLNVVYNFKSFSPSDLFKPTTIAEIQLPETVVLQWTQPATSASGPVVGVSKYRLVFRRQQTMPAGSYAWDAATSGARSEGLPNSNARPLRDDIVIEWSSRLSDDPVRDDCVGSKIRDNTVVYYHVVAKTDLNPLKDAGLIYDGHTWRPDAWQVFLQTESVAKVRSALAPVEIGLQFINKDQAVPLVEHFDERRTGQLEWLARPLLLRALPFEDCGEKEPNGYAYVPRPWCVKEDGTEDRDALSFKLALSKKLPGVRFLPHPDRVRCIHFIWNQGPSDDDAHPIDLHAGYQLFEFDAFAHAADALIKPSPTWERLIDRAGLRLVQEIQLVPPGDLLVTPSDTIPTSVWEAWYPSAARRLYLRGTTPSIGKAPSESNASMTPWYSWRDAELTWPPPMKLVDGDRRLEAQHDFLRELVFQLETARQFFIKVAQQVTDAVAEMNGAGDIRHPLTVVKGLFKSLGSIELEAGAFVIRDVADYWRIVNPATKERPATTYHLRRISDTLLAVSVSTGVIVDVAPLPASVESDFAGLRAATLTETDPYGWNILRRMGLSIAFTLRLPGQKIVEPTVTLELVRRTIDYLLNNTDDLRFKSLGPYVFVEHLFQTAKRTELRAERNKVGSEAFADQLLSLMQVSLRPVINQTHRYHVVEIAGEGGKTVKVKAKASGAGATFTRQPGTAGAEEPLEVNQDHPIIVRIPDSGRAMLLFRYQKADSLTVKHFESGDDIRISPALVTDWVSPHFNIPESRRTSVASWWASFQPYAIAIGATSGNTLHDSFRSPPSKEEDIADVLRWLERFFSHSGDIKDVNEAAGVTVATGPWQATAYQRGVSPVDVTPDKAGRLEYMHLIEDQNAQAYRYYFRPRSRYARLWNSIAESAVLFPTPDVQNSNLCLLDQLAPLPAGGLDVALSRIKQVEKPFVLSSSRLDEPSTGTNPAAPGTTWEVIVAKHPEQTLGERSDTLKSRLEFQRVIWSHARRFAFADKLTLLQDTLLTRKRSQTIVQPHDQEFVAGVTGNTFIITLTVDGQSFPITLPKEANRLLPIANAIAAKNAPVRVKALSPSANGYLEIIPKDKLRADIELKDSAGNSLLPNGVALDEPYQLRLRHVEDTLDDSVQLPAYPATAFEGGRLESHGQFEFAHLTADQRRMLDLPLRMGRSDQGAMVYQFEGLPYFYQQKLLLAAQAGTEVSPINEVIHGAFHYLSPVPEATMEGVQVQGGRKRRIEITLSRYWDCLDAAARRRWPSENPEVVTRVMCIAISADGHQVAAGNDAGVLRVCAADTGHELWSCHAHEGEIHGVCFHPDGTQLASCGADGVIKLWKSDTGLVAAQLTGSTGGVLTIAFNHDGTLLVSGGADSKVRIWDVASAKAKGAFTGGTGAINAVAFNHDSSRIVSAGSDKSVVLWKTDGTKSLDFPGHSGPVRSVIFSHDGQHIASAGENGFVRLWKTDNAAQFQDFTGHTDTVNCVRLNQAGTQLVTAGAGGTVRRWDASNGNPLNQINAHQGGVEAVALDPANAFLLTAGADAAVRSWDEATRKLKWARTMHAHKVSGLPDLDVVYQYVLASPGGVIEQVAELAFSETSNFCYGVRTLGPGYQTQLVQLLPPSATDVDDRIKLVSVFSKLNATDNEVTRRMISSRRNYQAVSATSVSFEPPNQCRLVLTGAISDQQLNDLQTIIREVKLDASFRGVLQQLLDQRNSAIQVLQGALPTLEAELRAAAQLPTGRVSTSVVREFVGLGIELGQRTHIRENGDKWTLDDGDRTHLVEKIDQTLRLSLVVRDNTADASVGLEQLREISPYVNVPRFGKTERDVIWFGALTTEQREILQRTEQVNGQDVPRGWIVVSDFRQTLAKLLELAAAKTIDQTFTGNAQAIPPELTGRLAVIGQTLTWTSLILAPDGAPVTDAQIVNALQLLAVNSAGQDFGNAVDKLLAALGYPRDGVVNTAILEKLTIPIQEVDWQPRMTEDDLQAQDTGHLSQTLRDQLARLKDRLLVRQGTVAFPGIMLLNEARAIRDGFKLVSGDRRSVEELFTDSVNSGLDRAKLQIRTLRGAAAMKTRDIDTIITDA